MPRHVSEYFTLPGRILALATLVLAIGGPFAYFAWVMDELPAGRYPLWLFAFPVLFGAALFFAAGTVLLTKLGIKVFRNPEAAEKRNDE
jgi:hypothetical protein